MKAYFVVSDIHGYYSALMSALKEAGYRKDNPDHLLIVLGDIFDRGNESKKVYSFLRSLPPSRRVLVRGNHESLLLELLFRGDAEAHDIANGTLDTLRQFCWGYRGLVDQIKGLGKATMDPGQSCQAADRLYRQLHHRLFHGQAIRQVAEWIQSREWVDYYETAHHVFVHAFIPVLSSPDPDWRNADHRAWEAAKWECPYERYLQGYWAMELAKGKTLVCGHWHTSAFYNSLDYRQGHGRFYESSDNPIYRSDFFPGLLGIDACTAITKKVNVLVLTEEEI